VSSDLAFCVEYFYARENCRIDLKEELLKLAELSKREEGCLQYDVLVDSENPDVFILFLKYESQAAMQAHEQQSYVQNFSEEKMQGLCEKVIWNDASLVNE
jgi:quinol monooxygenase YgiN